MIRSVKMKGWKSHEDTKVEFSRGTNVIVGIMGSGKSSMLQAITFGLFGEVPEVRSRKITLSDLLMRKPRKLEEATVEIEFDEGDIIYKVERILRRNGGDARLFREGKLLEVGLRRVTEKVVEILGTDYDGFVNVVYARQNNIDNFLRYGKSDRVKLIDSLLRIDRLEDARKQLRSFHTGVKSRLVDLREKAGKDITETRDFLKIAGDRVEKLKGEMSDLQAVVASSRETLMVEKLKFKKMDELRIKRDDSKSLISRLKGEIEAIESRIDSLPKISGASEKLRSAIERMGLIKEEERTLIAELSSLKSRRLHLERRLAELEPYKKIALKKLEDLGPALDKLIENRSRLAVEKESHDNSIEQLKSAGAKCPVCDSSLKNPKEHILRHEKAVSLLEKELANLSKKIHEMDEKKRKNDDLRAEIEKAKLMVKEIPKIEKELPKDLTPLEKRVDEAKLKVVGAEEEVERLKKAVERAEMESRLGDLQSQLSDLQKSFRSLGFNESTYSSLRDKVEEMSSSLSASLSRMQVIPKLIEARQAEAAALKKELDEVRTAKEELVRTEHNLDNLSVLINSIADVQVLVRQGFIELINDMLSEIWVQLYPYGDYASLRIFVESDGRHAGDYILQLREKKQWASVDGVASGGERSIASLALRVAFARSLSRLGLLLLDEPTHNLDDSGVDKLSDILREGMPSVLDQVIIITHEERMEKAATGSAYRLVRDKAIEGPTQVEKL